MPHLLVRLGRAAHSLGGMPSQAGNTAEIQQLAEASITRSAARGGAVDPPNMDLEDADRQLREIAAPVAAATVPCGSVPDGKPRFTESLPPCAALVFGNA
jgi:hypothetical protein